MQTILDLLFDFVLIVLILGGAVLVGLFVHMFMEGLQVVVPRTHKAYLQWRLDRLEAKQQEQNEKTGSQIVNMHLDKEAFQPVYDAIWNLLSTQDHPFTEMGYPIIIWDNSRTNQAKPWEMYVHAPYPTPALRDEQLLNAMRAYKVHLDTGVSSGRIHKRPQPNTVPSPWLD